MKRSTTSLEHEIKTALDAQQAALDATTRDRLRQARAAALDATARPRWWSSNWAMPAAVLATLAAVAVGVTLWLRPPVPVDEPFVASAAEPDVLIALAAADIELEWLEDDIEFYDWLALAEVDDASP